MQKNINLFFLVLGVPTFGEGRGGVDLVGTKSQIFPIIQFEGSPLGFPFFSEDPLFLHFRL